MKGDRTTITVSTKGRITLPAALRKRLKWEAGTVLHVELMEEGVLLRQPHFRPTTVEEVFGSLSGTRKARSVREMDQSIVEEARRRAPLPSDAVSSPTAGRRST